MFKVIVEQIILFTINLFNFINLLIKQLWTTVKLILDNTCLFIVKLRSVIIFFFLIFLVSCVQITRFIKSCFHFIVGFHKRAILFAILFNFTHHFSYNFFILINEKGFVKLWLVEDFAIFSTFKIYFGEFRLNRNSCVNAGDSEGVKASASIFCKFKLCFFQWLREEFHACVFAILKVISFKEF